MARKVLEAVAMAINGCGVRVVCFVYRNDAEGLVRWPPVKTWRHKLRRQIPNGGTDNNHVAAENGCGCSRASNSTYVKVKTEGVGIARKIDIGVHRSFETLTTTLMTMFDILDENLKCFKLAYQDKEGDRLLAEDVPWRTFVGSIKCLKLIRSRGWQLGFHIKLSKIIKVKRSVV
ncbi:auxin-responsive protein IAA11-like [Hibiscus syriacus]|uniref:auxin-responsive protein IAA11-like n=1 Tax=Hibiscus syriacus TaxID=106335 RepID=UPI0019217E06|nr:auxin-responsive protein IAA11-like [Hibiscus syriacus]